MKCKVTLLYILILLIQVNTLDAQCSITEAVDIPDLSPVTVNLIVEGSTNPDLSGDQGVCGIYLEFEHQQIGDLTIDLTSPDGQSVTLIGPVGSFGNTSFTDWQVLFVPCGAMGSPDPGFAEVWNNNQSWGILGDYSGSYHPYLGCLEDFDQGSINGIWSLQVLDNTLFDLGVLKNATIFFCDEAGLDCIACDANAGEFEVEQLNVCTSDADQIELDPIFPEGNPSSDYEFFYIVRQNQLILDIVDTLDLTSYAAGTYQVCGLSMHIDDLSILPNLEMGTFDDLVQAVEAVNPAFCGAINETCVTIFLEEPPTDVTLDITICEGSSYSIGGNSYSVADQYVLISPQANGCDSVYVLNLETVTIEAIVSSSTTVLSCIDPQITLTSVSSISSANANFSWSTMDGGFLGPTNEETVSVNQAGTYTLTIQDGLCVSSSSIQISADEDAPAITLTGDTLTCINTAVDIDFSSPETIVSFSWVGPNGFTSNLEDIQVDFPGTYTVTVEASNGCFASESILIQQGSDVPLLELSAPPLTCSQPQVAIDVLASSNSLTYVWSGPNGFSFVGKDPIVFEAGTYYVSATDELGCVGHYEIEVTGSGDNLSYALAIEDIFCPNGSATLSIDIDDPEAVAQWTLPDLSTILGLSISTTQSGIYSVTIISQGCQETEIFEVLEDFMNVPNAEPNQSAVIDCDNPNVTLFLNVTENEVFVDSVAWFGPGGFISNDQDIEVSLSGIYSAFIYSIDGCVREFNYSLEFDASVPEVFATISGLTCTNDNAGIITTSASVLSYSWEGPSGFSSTDSVLQNLIPGGYNLTVTNSENCTREYYYEVPADTLSNDLEISVTGVLNCAVDSVEIQLGFAEVTGVTWSSTNGFMSNEINIKVDQAGIYFVEAEGIENGCIARDTIEVLQDIAAPNLNVEDQAFNCGQNSLVLEATSNTPNVVYSWSGPSGFVSSVSAPIVFEEGQYELTVIGLNGCSTTESVNVTQDNEIPDISASFSNDLDCINTQSIITGSTATNNVTFIWKGPNGIFDDPVITVDIPGDYTFVVTGQNGCSDSVIINVPFTGSYPEFTALGDTLFCGETFTSIDVAEVTGGVSYTWSGPNGFTSNTVFNDFVEPGEYVLSGLAANGCVSLDTAIVLIDTVAAILDVLVFPDTLTCSQILTQVELSTDKGFSLSSWTGPMGFSESALSIEVSNPGIYFFTGISENNCSTNLQIEVIQDISPPQFTLSTDTINCNNTEVVISLLNDDTESSYSWEAQNYTSDLQSPTVDEEGFYYITVTGRNGCQSVDSIEVTKDISKPDLVAVNDTLPCDGSAIELFALTLTEGAEIRWFGPNGFDSIGPSPTTDLAGTYFIEVVGTNGCSTNTSIELFDVPAKPDFVIDKSSDINCEFLAISLYALETEDDISVLWTGPNNFSSTEDSIITSNAGVYYLEVLGKTGCSRIDSVEVTVDTLAPQIQIEQTGRILCDITDVGISAVGSSEGNQFIYDWKTNDGIIKQGAKSLAPTIEGPGTYTLIIKNEENQCVNRDSIEILVEQSTLQSVMALVDKQTCRDFEDGVIEVLSVSGGVKPYRYALEGNSFTQNAYFDELASGVYNLIVKDSFGCVLDTAIWLGLERDVQIDLGEDIQIDLGESVNLQAISSIPAIEIADIFWEPSGIIDCNNCLSFEFVPAENMVVKIEVIDVAGCSAVDQLVIRVNEEINLYIPNAFTPNNDGVNDVFSISTSSNVEKVIFFDIYDRWGSKVFSDENFIPGEGLSWDGTHLGQTVQQGAFVFLAQLQMVNGKTEIIKGNITVIR